MPTPSWQSARNGLPGDTNAVDKSAQINQLLGTHGVTPIYTGNQVVTPQGQPQGSTDPSNFWVFHLDQFEYDQPFPMSGTAIGRVVLPFLPVGKGADLLVSLCADSGGVPGTVLNKVRIPASWFTAFAACQAAAGPSSQTLLTVPGGALQVAQFNALQRGAVTSTNWASPSSSGSIVAANPTSVTSGNFMIQVGGTGVGGNPVANVFTIPFAGGSQLSPAIPQPSVPQTTFGASVAATADTLVCAGGANTLSSLTANVYTASWSPTTGTMGAWSQQASVPQALSTSATAVFGETVYLIGGYNATTTVSTVYYATVQNGQIQSWNTGPPLPISVRVAFAAVVGNLLIIMGGLDAGLATPFSNVYFANINADGSLGSWQTGPSLPTAVGQTAGQNMAVLSNGVVILGGSTGGGGFSPLTQTLFVGPNGLGSWQVQTQGGSADVGAFALGPGESQGFVVFSSFYSASPIYMVPRISVPLPTTGLTNGATYHILMQQQGGDLNNYLRTRVDSNVFSGNPTALFRNRGGSSWTGFFAGFAVPLSVYDNTPGGNVLHTWEDSGNRITTLAYASTPDARLLGLAEATQFADGTVLADVAAINYPGTWPAGAWPPLGVTQLA